ncbi:hypothetical protein IWW48_000573 [Coemansia sp. RSA 1200]|nr:hypothetical protein IWW48_000573 [Coemansia sp. RSA 1200]
MVSFLGSKASGWTVTSGLVLMALARGSAGNLTGSGTITYHDYQAIPLAALQYNPPSCGMPYAELDVTRITAVQQMDKATDCGQCVKVSNANDPSKSVYVLAVDTGGRGLDLSKPAFGQILNIDDGVGAATWEPVGAANCAGIWSNGAQQQPAPSSSSSLVVAPPAPTSSAPAAAAPAPTTVQLPAQPATHVQAPRSTTDDAPTPQDSAPPATAASVVSAPAPATAQGEAEQTVPQPAESEINESGKDELGALMSSDSSSEPSQSVGDVPDGVGHHGEESDTAAGGEADAPVAADELSSAQHDGALESLQTSDASMAKQAPLFITSAAVAAAAVFALLC